MIIEKIDIGDSQVLARRSRLWVQEYSTDYPLGILLLSNTANGSC
jgi:hypothetical protein